MSGKPETLEETYNVALVGITGALGREIQSALEVDHEGIEDFFAIAGAKSAGHELKWRGQDLTVSGLADVKPSDVDFAIFATPSHVVARDAGRLLEAGSRLLDASGALASTPLPRGVAKAAPVVWPGLSTFQTVDLEMETALSLPSAAASTLAPLLDAILLGKELFHMPKLKAVHVTALLPASQAGREGIDALSRQAVGLLNYRPVLDPRPFPASLAFNAVVPAPESSVLFEAKTAHELRRLLPELSQTAIELQPIWMPAFTGICLSVTLRFEEKPDLVGFEKLLAAHPDLRFGTAEVDASEDDQVLEEGESVEQTFASDPDALSLRDVVDQDEVSVSTPLFNEEGAVRLVLMADPIQRTARATSQTLHRWMAAISA